MAMNKDYYLLTFNEIFLSEDGKIPPVQVLKVGEFDIPGVGRVKVTPSVLRSLKNSFEQNTRRVKLAFNYDHGRSKAHGSKAAGWISAAELRADDSELWLSAEWTPNAEKEILGKEYRYTSAEILVNYKDNESGKVFDWVLKGAALTNLPVIKGMEAIAASEFCGDEPNTEMEGKKKMATKAEIMVDLAENHSIDLSELQKKAKLADESAARVVELSEENSSLKSDKSKLEGENKALKEKVELSEKSAKEFKFSELSKKGMEEGKLTKVMVEGTFKTMFDTQGAEYCEAYLSEAGVIVDVGDARGSDGGKSKTKDGDSDKKASVKLSEMSRELAAKEKIELSEAQDRVFAENPELVKAYDAEFKEN